MAGKGGISQSSLPATVARTVLGGFFGGASSENQPTIEDALSGWDRIAIQLHPLMPYKDYDALRARYFYQEIAPLLPEGSSTVGALNDFRGRTERPKITNPVVSTIGQVATSIMKGAGLVSEADAKR